VQTSLHYGICDDYEVLSQRLLTLGYSSEELQYWHLSVALTSCPLHATVDLLRSRLPCQLNNQGSGTQCFTSSLCVKTEAEALFKSLKAMESKGPLSKHMRRLDGSVSRREGSHEVKMPQQSSILLERCKSFLSGWAFP
jgi:hypothetical protein